MGYCCDIAQLNPIEIPFHWGMFHNKKSRRRVACSAAELRLKRWSAAFATEARCWATQLRQLRGKKCIYIYNKKDMIIYIYNKIDVIIYIYVLLIYLCIYLSVYLSIYRSNYLSIYRSIDLSIYRSIYRSIYLLDYNYLLNGIVVVSIVLWKNRVCSSCSSLVVGMYI
jgi:hypothetical protein